MGEASLGAGGDRRERARSSLREELGPGEPVLAEGAAHWWFRDGAEFHAYLFVTPDRLLWTDDRSAGRVWSLPLEAVTGCSEQGQAHRYILRLRHGPLERVEHGHRWRFLWWTWGNADRRYRRTDTTFMFSRRDTEAARALRTELEARGIIVG